MKKLVCLVFAIAMLVPFALADDTGFDLSGLTFEQLAELRTACLYEMFQRDEWQEVTVPQGNYRVGVDIPAGRWVIRCSDTGRNSYLLARCDISWGTAMPEDGRIPVLEHKGEVQIYNPKNAKYNGEITEYVIDLAEGDWVAIHPQYNSVVFTPYTGTSFAFK